MVNMTFKHPDIDRLSPFSSLNIRDEGELLRSIGPMSVENLRKVKAHLPNHPITSRQTALLHIKNGMRISEPVLARFNDLVLDNDFHTCGCAKTA